MQLIFDSTKELNAFAAEIGLLTRPKSKAEAIATRILRYKSDTFNKVCEEIQAFCNRGYFNREELFDLLEEQSINLSERTLRNYIVYATDCMVADGRLKCLAAKKNENRIVKKTLFFYIKGDFSWHADILKEHGYINAVPYESRAALAIRDRFNSKGQRPAS